MRTILDGVTHGGSKISEETDILNQKASLELLVNLIKSGDFNLDYKTFCALHNVAAKEERITSLSFWQMCEKKPLPTSDGNCCHGLP